MHLIMNKYGIIYCVKNKINGKVYVGQTIKSLEKRKRRHERAIVQKKPIKGNRIFALALRKYGADAFEWSILKECQNFVELNEQEMYFIKLLNANNSKHGYNNAPGGNGYVPEKHSHKHTEESKLKISLKVKESLKNPETILRKKLANEKYWSKQESHEKLSKTIKELWQDPKYRDKIHDVQSNRVKELWQTEDYKLKQAELSKRRWTDPVDTKNMLRGFTELHKKFCKFQNCKNEFFGTINAKYCDFHRILKNRRTND